MHKGPTVAAQPGHDGARDNVEQIRAQEDLACIGAPGDGGDQCRIRRVVRFHQRLSFSIISIVVIAGDRARRSLYRPAILTFESQPHRVRVVNVMTLICVEAAQYMQYALSGHFLP